MMRSRFQIQAEKLFKTAVEVSNSAIAKAKKNIEQHPLYKKWITGGNKRLIKYSNERVVKNSPQTVRREFSKMGQSGIIPDDWLKYLYTKTESTEKLLKTGAELTRNAVAEARKTIEQHPLYREWIIDRDKKLIEYSGERDEKNFPHPIRREFPEKVRFGFIPDEWFTYFYPKTGVTGPYVFGLSLSTFLVSKEIYVLDHNFYTGISMAILCVIAVKKFGPPLAAYLDSEVDKEINEWNEEKEQQLDSYDKAIEWERQAQLSAKSEPMLTDAKRQMVALQLEAAFRECQMEVYTEVVRRLDYAVAMSHARTIILIRHMSSWVEDRVAEELKKDSKLQQLVLAQCIARLRVIVPQEKGTEEGTPAPNDSQQPEIASPSSEAEPAAQANT